MTIITEISNLQQDNIKQTVTDILTKQVTTIKFTKVDGTVREMKATLCADFIETVPVTESAQPKKDRRENPDVRTVYDVDVKAWKSFRWDKLISITHNEVNK